MSVYVPGAGSDLADTGVALSGGVYVPDTAHVSPAFPPHSPRRWPFSAQADFSPPVSDATEAPGDLRWGA